MRRIMGVVTLALVASLLAIPAAQERPLPDFNTFAAEVKKHLATDEERQSGYMYIERRIDQRLDGSGKSTRESVKVYEVYPGLPGEDRYRRLIEEDGKPVPQGTLAQKDSERRKEVGAYARRISTPSERQKETQQLAKARQRYGSAVDDVFRIYDIRMVRRELVDGH